MARMRREFKDYEEKNIETTDQSPAEVETNGPRTKNGTVVNTSLVNVRSKPSMESDVLEILKRGDKVRLHGKVAKFYKVSTTANGVGYIALDFIKED